MPATSKHLSAEKRREVTVSAVIQLAATQDPADISTTAIANHMDVTQGALFRHFANKEAIWKAVMEWVATSLIDRVDSCASTAATPLAALDAVFLGHIGFVGEYPGVPRILLGELQRSEDTEAKQIAQVSIEKYRERVSALIKDGQDKGEIDLDVDSVAAATLFLGSIQGLVMQSLLKEGAKGDMKGLKEKAPGVFAIIRRGIVLIP